jgi:hypothetical protein
MVENPEGGGRYYYGEGGVSKRIILKRILEK